MRLHVDLETLQLIEGPGFRNPVASLRFKRGDGARLEVVFLENGTTPVAIGDPALLELRFGVKPRGRYESGYLAHTASWTLPAEGAENPVYRCSPSFNTVELDAALGVGSLAGPELAELTLMGEVTWREGSGEPTSTRTFLVVVENDVNRGTEGVPGSACPAYPAPGQLALRSDLDDAFGIQAVLGRDMPLEFGWQDFPGFSIHLPTAGVWELDGRYFIANAQNHDGVVQVRVDLNPGTALRDLANGRSRSDLRVTHNDERFHMTDNLLVEFTENPDTGRVTGFIDISEPVNVKVYAVAVNAGIPSMAAGSWIRATFLTMPAGSCYGAGAIGGGLL